MYVHKTFSCPHLTNNFSVMNCIDSREHMQNNYKTILLHYRLWNISFSLLWIKSTGTNEWIQNLSTFIHSSDIIKYVSLNRLYTVNIIICSCYSHINIPAKHSNRRRKTMTWANVTKKVHHCWHLLDKRFIACKWGEETQGSCRMDLFTQK